MFAAGIAALFTVHTASADTLFDNFYYTGTNGNPGYNTNSGSAKEITSYSDNVDIPGYQYAEAFTAPFTATVDSITLPLDVDPFTYDQPDPSQVSATIVLYADNNGAPGAVLFSQVITSLSDVRLGLGPNITAVLVSGVTVSAGEQYWVGVNQSNVTSGRSIVYWFDSNSDMSTDFDDTSSFSNYYWYGVRTNPNVQYDGYSPALFVSGTPVVAPVPLPASAWSGAVMLCAMGTTRLFRRRSARNAQS